MTEITESAELRRQLREHIRQAHMVDPEHPLDDDGSLMGHGILDSTGVLELVAYLEETYGIEIADEEIIPENLDSIDKLCRYVRSRIGS